MKMIAVIAYLTFLSSAHAAVSGFHDSAERIAAIFASSDVADILRQAPVVNIKQVGEFDYLVFTSNCQATVELTEVPPNGLGKTTYKVGMISYAICP